MQSWLEPRQKTSFTLLLSPTRHAFAPGASVPGTFDWRDAVLYFVVVDPFADGDPGNNVKVDRAATGAFHGPSCPRGT